MQFARTPGSGSGAIKGDVIPIRGFEFDYVVECKHVQSVTIDSLYTGAGMLWSFFRKLESECTGSLRPLLIFKKKNLGAMAVMYASSFETLTNVPLQEVTARKFEEFFVVRYKTAKNKLIKLIVIPLDELEKLTYAGKAVR